MRVRASLFAFAMVVSSAVMAAPAPGKVTGSFIIGGTDAHLKYVRAKQVKLDEKGHMGYAVLLSERPSTGDIEEWRTAEPAKSGNFVHVIFEPSGAIWVAELGHTKAKSGRFGVVTEIQKLAFEVKDQRIAAHIKTNGEQSFGDDHFTVDLTFDAPLEK